MGFALAQTETFKSLVKVNVRTSKGANGTWREETFTAIFKRVDEDDRERLAAMKYSDVLREVLVSWDGVTVSEEDKTPVPFTPENFEGFLLLSGAVRETANQFFLDNFNIKEARAKN